MFEAISEHYRPYDRMANLDSKSAFFAIGQSKVDLSGSMAKRVVVLHRPQTGGNDGRAILTVLEFANF